MSSFSLLTWGKLLVPNFSIFFQAINPFCPTNISEIFPFIPNITSKHIISCVDHQATSFPIRPGFPGRPSFTLLPKQSFPLTYDSMFLVCVKLFRCSQVTCSTKLKTLGLAFKAFMVLLLLEVILSVLLSCLFYTKNTSDVLANDLTLFTIVGFSKCSCLSLEMTSFFFP